MIWYNPYHLILGRGITGYFIRFLDRARILEHVERIYLCSSSMIETEYLFVHLAMEGQSEGPCTCLESGFSTPVFRLSSHIPVPLS